jgi:hypothetical protein
LLDELGRKINKFLQSIERDHQSVRDHAPEYGDGQQDDRESRIEHRESSDEHPTSNIQNPSSDEDPTS